MTVSYNKEVSNSGPPILEYAPPSLWTVWWSRHRKRVLAASVGIVVIAVLYNINLVVYSYTLDDPRTGTAQHSRGVALCGHLLYERIEAVPFVFADIIAPTTNQIVPVPGAPLLPRNASYSRFELPRLRDTRYVRCIGMRTFSKYLCGVEFVRRRMPGASTEERRDVLIAILQRTKKLSEFDPDKNRPLFLDVAEEVLNKPGPVPAK